MPPHVPYGLLGLPSRFCTKCNRLLKTNVHISSTLLRKLCVHYANGFDNVDSVYFFYSNPVYSVRYYPRFHVAANHGRVSDVLPEDTVALLYFTFHVTEFHIRVCRWQEVTICHFHMEGT
jgi:hypothetical protein